MVNRARKGRHLGISMIREEERLESSFSSHDLRTPSPKAVGSVVLDVLTQTWRLVDQIACLLGTHVFFRREDDGKDGKDWKRKD